MSMWPVRGAPRESRGTGEELEIVAVENSMQFPSAAGARPGRVGSNLQLVPLVPLGKSQFNFAELFILIFFFPPVEVARCRRKGRR